MKISTFDKKFLDQVTTCIDIFNCNWLWYLVDAVEMLLDNNNPSPTLVGKITNGLMNPFPRTDSINHR